MAKDLIGPGAFGASNAVTARPAVAPDNTTGASDTWFKNCSSATSRDGTTIEEGYLNFLLAQIRRAIRGMGIAESNVDDDMLLKAIQAASSGGEFPAHTHAQSEVINLVADLATITAAIAGKVAKAGDTMTGVLLQPAGSAAAPALAASGDTDTGIFYAAANILALATGGVERLRVDASGNVGIETLAPGAKLDVNGNAITRGEHRLKAASYPKLLFESTGNSADARKWQCYLDPSGQLNLKRLNDAENAESAGTLHLNGAIGLAGDIGSAAKVFTGGSNAAWKTLAELGVGRKIVAVGRATGASAAITFASAEPDTSYEVAGYGGWGGSGDNSGGTSTNLSLSSKSTGGCTVNLNDEGGGAPTGSVRMFYIIFRNT